MSAGGPTRLEELDRPEERHLFEIKEENLHCCILLYVY